VKKRHDQKERKGAQKRGKGKKGGPFEKSLVTPPNGGGKLKREGGGAVPDSIGKKAAEQRRPKRVDIGRRRLEKSPPNLGNDRGKGKRRRGGGRGFLSEKEEKKCPPPQDFPTPGDA